MAKGTENMKKKRPKSKIWVHEKAKCAVNSLMKSYEHWQGP